MRDVIDGGMTRHFPSRVVETYAERVVVRQEDGASETTFSCKPHSGPESLSFRAPTVTDTSCILPFTRQVYGEQYPTIKCYRPTVIPHHKVQSSYCDTSHKQLWSYCDTSTQSAVVLL